MALISVVITLFKPAPPLCGPEDDLRSRYCLNQDQWREYWCHARNELMTLLPQFPDKFPEELVNRFPNYYQYLNMKTPAFNINVICNK